MIVPDLLAEYDRHCKADPGLGWKNFSRAVLEWVLQSGSVSKVPQDLIRTALVAWMDDPPRDERLTEARVGIWNYFQEKNGNSSTVADLEDAMLRTALFGLQPHGDRQDSVESLGWIEEFLARFDS